MPPKSRARRPLSRRAAVAALLRSPALLQADPAVQQLIRELFTTKEPRPAPGRPVR
jgi:hypothetical protein